MDKIIGKITRVIFKNEENNYTIASIELEDGGKTTIVGYFPALSEDVIYDFYGSWVEHKSFGLQFKVESFSQSDAQTIDGLISYLSSSIFKGIGPVTAAKIVSHLGQNAINKIIEDKYVLREIGFKDEKSEYLYDQLIANKETEHILVVLYGYELTGRMSMKLIDRYGLQTLSVLEENPYQLIEDVEGIGFIKADEIAKKMGIEDDDERRIYAAIFYTLSTTAYQNGDVYLKKDEIYKFTNSVLGVDVSIDESLEKLVIMNKIIVEEDRYYIAQSYLTEEAVANELIRINNAKTSEIDIEYVKTLLEMFQIKRQIEYTKSQEEAIIEALSSNLYIITGGPGTGKTTIIEGILNIYSLYYNLNLASPQAFDKITLLAPTGRAAKRMKEMLDFDAKTIHRQLGYGYDGMFSYDEDNQLPHDLIIVDEASMIDQYLAKRLFSAVKSGSRLIIIGDVDQLPSVSPGQVLRDVIESRVFPTKRLDQIHRQAHDSHIIKLSKKVNERQVTYDDLNSYQDITFINSYFQQVRSYIIGLIERATEKGYDLIEDVQVLIPLYKGELGIDLINQAIQDKYIIDKSKFMTYGDMKYYIGDKVIQLVNDPERDVMNGDIGYIKRIGINAEKEQYMVVDFDGNEAIYKRAELEELNLAYAISIHKSQGSEYKIIVIPLVKSYMHMLKKELIYTAMTRAKQSLIFIGEVGLLVYASNQNDKMRQTTLRERIINLSK